MADSLNGQGRAGCTDRFSGVLLALVVSVAALAAAAVVLLVPMMRDASRRNDAYERQTALAAPHIQSGDAAFAAGKFDQAAMDYMIAAGIRAGDPDIAAMVSRARIAGIASNPTLIDNVNMLETRNDAALVEVRYPQDMTSVRIVKAMLKARSGNVADATALLDEALKADPQSGYVRLAQAVIWQLEPSKAAGVAAEFDAAVAARPDDPTTLGIAGEYFVNTKTPEKGLQMLKTASRSIRNANWLKMLTAEALQLNDKEGALAYIQSAYTMAPRDPEVLSLMGQVLLNSSDYEKAVSILSQAASIRETRDTLFKLGIAYNALKQFDRALPVLAKVNQQGADIMSLFEYGNALAGSGQKDEAARVYGGVLSIDEQRAGGVPANVVSVIKERAKEALDQLGIQPAK